MGALKRILRSVQLVGSATAKALLMRITCVHRSGRRGPHNYDLLLSHVPLREMSELDLGKTVHCRVVVKHGQPPPATARWSCESSASLCRGAVHSRSLV